jgi:septal ring factor EnvC (AmiA/AmiB activator)
MGRLTTILIFCCLAFISIVRGQGQKEKILDQKKDLEQIQREVEQGRHRLDSLKNDELGVQESISDYDQKIASDRKVISRLNSKLKKVKSDISAAEQQLDRNQKHHEQTRRRFLESIRRFYLAARSPTEITSEHPNQELELNRRVIYLTAVAGFEAGNVAAASEFLDESVVFLQGRTGEKDRVAGLKKKKETATALDKGRKEREQKKLQAVRRRKTEEADHLLMLQQAAEEMEAIIARLETQHRPRPGNEPAPPSLFATMEGKLPSPVRGKVVETFGHKVHPVTKLKSFSPGITIRAAAGRTVSAVAPGTVAYVGDLRGYGEFIILDHGDQYFSTYAGLSQVAAAVGRYVHAGDKLAAVGADGRMKFELRFGREALDPVKWMRFDAL